MLNVAVFDSCQTMTGLMVLDVPASLHMFAPAATLVVIDCLHLEAVIMLCRLS